MNSTRVLEILYGTAGLPELLWLVLLTVYLSRESNRRGLRWHDWFKLPPSMNLILAVFLVDLAFSIRAILIWLWRRGGSGEFNDIQIAILIIAGAMVIVGTLCKIRAITHPDYGNGPWLTACGVTVVSLIGLVIF